MYEVPSRDNVQKCIVTADVVTKHKDPKLLLKEQDNTDTRKRPRERKRGAGIPFPFLCL